MLNHKYMSDTRVSHSLSATDYNDHNNVINREAEFVQMNEFNGGKGKKLRRA